MRIKKREILLIIALILFLNNGLKAQEIDINKSIQKIRTQYGLIVNEEIDNLLIDTVDLSYYPTQEETEESTWSDVNKFIIYQNLKDTFLIRNISIQDEGGAYSSRKTEVFFWENTPFFFYSESEGLWGGIMKETRIYIENNQVIRKLYKEAQFFSSSTGYIDVSMDTIPNQTMPIEEKDLITVMDFVKRSKSDIKNK